MSSYAIYRLPYHDQCTLVMQTHGEPLVVSSLAELNGKEGFVIAPFSASQECPILLLKPDVVETMQVQKACHSFSQTSMKREETSILAAHLPPVLMSTGMGLEAHYAIDFANFHAQLEAGAFSKIVLARRVTVTTDESISPEDLFMHACNLYPRMFVALVSAEKSGTWLVATPETLLEGNGNRWHTMALAGTIKLSGEQLGFDNPPSADMTGKMYNAQPIAWSDKNIQEQRYVATYITQCLERFTDDFTEEGPYTARAGNLVHLRSDFNFKLDDVTCLGDVINELHPTPAVCGIPKEDAREFILANESVPRKYYSGFMGILNPNGDTNIYVSLRCMQIDGNMYGLYAGGGLLIDSVEKQEWGETEAKMKTMKRCLVTKKI